MTSPMHRHLCPGCRQECKYDAACGRRHGEALSGVKVGTEWEVTYEVLCDKCKTRPD